MDINYREPNLSTTQTDNSLSSVNSFEALNLSIDGCTTLKEHKSLKIQCKELKDELSEIQEKASIWRKKCNELELERINSFSINNKELSEALNNVAKFQAQCEKSETLKQSLEYELSKTQVELQSEKRATIEKQNILNELNGTLQKRMNEMTNELEKLHQDLFISKKEAKNESDNHMQSLKQQELRLSELTFKVNILEKEKTEILKNLQQSENVVQDLKERLKEIQKEKKLQADSLRDHINGLNVMKETEQSLNVQFKVTNDRIHYLEEQLDNERSSHAESKFAWELLQLKVKDLSNCLETEKTSKNDSLNLNEKLNNQLFETQTLYENEKQKCNDFQNKYTQLQGEFKILKKQLNEEVSDKKHIMTKLCGQLELHQSHINQLKNELNEAKDAQMKFNNNYENNLSDIEHILNSYQFTDSNRRKFAKGNNNLCGTRCAEGVKKVLQEYKRKYKELRDEIESAKECVRKEKGEKEQIKQQFHSKERVLDNVKQSQSSITKEIKKLRIDLSERDTMVAKLRSDLKLLNSNLVKEKEHSENLNNQLKKNSVKTKGDEENRIQYIHNLFHRLKNGKTPSKSSSNLTWSQVTNLLNDQVSLVIETLRKTDTKLIQLEEEINNQNEKINRLQENHFQEITSLNIANQDRLKKFMVEKNILEEHYKKVLCQVEGQQKETKALADQALNRVRSNGAVRANLEDENEHLKECLNNSKRNEMNSRLAIRLLSGSIIPFCNRNINLIKQKRLLSKELQAYYVFKSEIQQLVLALNFKKEISKSQSKSFTVLSSPLLKFRSIVIGVLAANRFKIFLKYKTKHFLVDDACTGLKKISVEWNENDSLISDVMSSMSDLQIVLAQNNNDERVIYNSAENSFMKMLSGLSNYFEVYNYNIDASSLLSQLGSGLMNAQRHTNYRDCTIKTVQLGLQQQLLNFTKKIHSCELDKRDINCELQQLRAEKLENDKKNTNVYELKYEVNELIKRASCMVSRQQFEGVCNELTAALKREEKAQSLLKDQNLQLDEMKNQAIRDAGIDQQNKMLISKIKKHEEKFELVDKELKLNLRNVSECQHKIKDAERSLKTLSKDKQILKTYMKNVEIALEQITQQNIYESKVVDLTPLLSADLIPVTPKPPAELAQCQLLVTTFVDTYQRINQRIYQSQEEVLSYRHEIGKLKQLSNKKTVDSNNSRNANDHFKPLLIDNSLSPVGPDGDKQYFEPIPRLIQPEAELDKS